MERIEGLSGPHSREGGDVQGSSANDRRSRRSDNITQALRYLLDACRDAGRLDAMALADRDGLLLAFAGDRAACEEVAARVAAIPVDVGSFRGTVIGEGGSWPIHMRKLRVSDLAIYVCAIGGKPDDRMKQVSRAATGIERILA
jgi:hypothetical protein